MFRLLRKLKRRPPPAATCGDILENDFGHALSVQTASCVDRTGRPIPWYTYPAIEYLRQLDFSQSAVFEFGAGHSTLFWGALAKRVVSVESDRVWFERIRPQIDATSTELHFLPERQAYVNAIRERPETFDVIVVDGQYRRPCAQQALDKLNPGGLIILDNSDWYPRTCALLRQADLIEVDLAGFGPINNYTWTTSLFLERGFRLSSRADVRPLPGIGSIPCTPEDD